MSMNHVTIFPDLLILSEFNFLILFEASKRDYRYVTCELKRFLGTFSPDQTSGGFSWGIEVAFKKVSRNFHMVFRAFQGMSGDIRDISLETLETQRNPREHS